MKKLLILALAVVSFAGCTTVPFDETKPLSYGVGFFREGYMQGDEFVEQDRAREALKTVPAADEKLKSAQAYQWGALGMIIGGVVIADVSIANWHDGPAPTGYWIGLATILGSIPLSITAQSRYRQAADAYNGERFVVKPKTSFYLSPLKDGGLAGARFTF